MTNLPLVQRFPCTYVMPGTEPFQGEVLLGWHPDIPPLVRMDLRAPDHDDTAWFLSRDVLVECALGDKGRFYGEGDFRVERGDVSGQIVVRSHIPDGEGGYVTHTCQVTFFIDPLLRFVHDTLMLVPRGKAENEPMGRLLDAWLETL